MAKIFRIFPRRDTDGPAGVPAKRLPQPKPRPWVAQLAIPVEDEIDLPVLFGSYQPKSMPHSDWGADIEFEEAILQGGGENCAYLCDLTHNSTE